MKILLALLLLLPGMAMAADPTSKGWPDSITVPTSKTVREFQDWRIEQSKVLVAAVTINEDGAQLGQLCGKACTYYLNANSYCATGEVYPGILNTPQGSMPLVLRCTHVKEEGEDYSVLLVEQDLTDALAAGAEVNIAVPTQAGSFSVIRFSTAGALEARTEMLRIAAKRDKAGTDIL